MIKRNKLVISLGLLAACSPPGGENGDVGPQDDHFTCAAMISAADGLVGTGQANDELIARKGLEASMRHLNAWAIPKGMKENEAFEAVKKERDQLLGSLPPKEIIERAKRCIETA